MIATAPIPALLSARQITKRFVGITALSSVELDIEAGRVQALVGENGAGKSTLIKIISGQLQPDAGSIKMDGVETVFRTPADAINHGISIVPQELSLVQDMTVAENIFLGHFARRGIFVDFAGLARGSRNIMSRLGLDISPDDRVGDLSPGNQKLVEIARGLSKDARIFILDEPTAALTDTESVHLFAVLRELKKSGCAILYVSHRMSEIPEVAEDVTVLRDGEVVKKWHGEAVSEDEIVQAMVGRSVARFFNTPRQHHGQAPEALRVENLNRRGVLKDVSFSVAQGEILSLSGLMGAGRTEVLRALFGVDQIDSGRVFVGGKETRIVAPRDAIRAGIAFVPEERKAQGLVEMMSIADNISLPHLRRWARAGLISDNARKREIAGIADQVRVKFGALGDPVRSLSGGNQQKIVLGKWLIQRPRIFLLDEPTRGIDVGAKFEIYTLISQLAADGCAVILVSSELPEVLGLADRILVLKDGGIVGELKGEGATEHVVLQLAMLGAEAKRAA